MPEYCLHHFLHLRVSGSGSAVQAAAEILSGFPLDCRDPAPRATMTSALAPPTAQALTSSHLVSTEFRLLDDDGEFTLFMPERVQDDHFVRQGAKMLCRLLLAPMGATVTKAAAISYRGHGILVGGVRGAGKSSSALLPLLDPRYKFLSDDTTIIRQDGMLFAFPQPVYVRHYQLDELPDELLRSSRRRAKVSRLVHNVGSVPGMHEVAAAAKRGLMRSSVLRNWAREVANGGAHIPPASLFASESMESQAPTSALLFLRPGDTHQAETLDSRRAASYLASLSLNRTSAPLVSEFALADAFDGATFLQVNRPGFSGDSVH